MNPDMEQKLFKKFGSRLKELSICRPVGMKFTLGGGGLKGDTSKTSKNGGPGTCPGKFCHDPAL